MTKSQKAEVINFLSNEFKSTEAIAVCDYKGMTVKQIETLRLAAVDQNAKVRVVKNTLTNIALENADKSGYELVDTNIVVWGDDQLNVAKLVAKFDKDYDLFNIKKAYLDGSFKEGAELIALSKMPGREELLGMLGYVWNAPLINLVTGLDNLAKKLEEEA
jgi:large subunit ribosomal protein L10